jgi:hypothetical protein
MVDKSYRKRKGETYENERTRTRRNVRRRGEMKRGKTRNQEEKGRNVREGEECVGNAGRTDGK